jgi:hypothetical protein
MINLILQMKDIGKVMAYVTPILEDAGFKSCLGYQLPRQFLLSPSR